MDTSIDDIKRLAGITEENEDRSRQLTQAIYVLTQAIQTLKAGQAEQGLQHVMNVHQLLKKLRFPDNRQTDGYQQMD